MEILENTVESEKTTFHVGICMAGAISAGAYTAGVMDYLLEALEHWQKAKKLQSEGKILNTGDYQTVPIHNFLIEVLGGASAGGMTAAIAAAATQIDFQPVRQSDEANIEKTKQNPLFDSWVNLTETADNDMIAQMLNTDDILASDDNKEKEVRAAFNSSFVKKIADSVLDKSIEETHHRPYFAADADIFTTVTNLRGFDYKIIFRTTSGDRHHRMKMHRDYAFFKFSENKESAIPLPEKISGDGSKNTSNLPNDGRIPINFNAPKGLNVQILKQAAMSTGAFPIGLESRNLSREQAYIKANKHLNLMLSVTDNVDYELTTKEELFETLNVDGGVINNEPYDITQSLLDDRRKNASGLKDGYVPEVSAATFESTVIMIDPFPSDEDTEDAFVSRKALRNIVPSIISAMRGQLMMKDEQIKRAYLSDDYTRFLIMPVRSSIAKDKESQDDAVKFPIACGSLGGFGGFFSKKFRTHDYFLGRRNCQKFIQEHFSAPVDANNPILKYGYGENSEYIFETINPNAKIIPPKNETTEPKTETTVSKTESVEQENETIDPKTDTTEPNPKPKTVKYLPLIPDFRIVGDDNVGYKLVKPEIEEKYPYPKIKLSYLLGLKPKIQDRVSCVLDNALNAEKNDLSNKVPKFKSEILPAITKESKFWNFLSRILLKIYLGIGKFFGKKTITKMCVEIIIEDMEKRKLIEVDVN